MKPETVERRLKKYRAELKKLSGPCDRTTAEGRKRHNRKSAIYRNMKRTRMSQFKRFL